MGSHDSVPGSMCDVSPSPPPRRENSMADPPCQGPVPDLCYCFVWGREVSFAEGFLTFAELKIFVRI